MAKKEKDKFIRPTISKDANNTGLIIAITALVGVIVFTIGFSFYIIPNVILSQRDEEVAERSRRASDEAQSKKNIELATQTSQESQLINFADQKVKFEFKDFGDININVLDKAAPKNSENFLRLVYRGYYDNTLIHRIVESSTFNIVQGGDPNTKKLNPDPTTFGTGGETATGEIVPDEVWEVKPEFDTTDPESTKLLNEPKFRDASLYNDWDPATGQVTYRKGLILMAKTNQPDSATSQFFITLGPTTLPADYTVFGTISEENFGTLDKIASEVEPVSTQTNEPATDGYPSKEIKIAKAEIVK
jgi:cyclophilin family peptidyl-prolyl cis-trans isomerase